MLIVVLRTYFLMAYLPCAFFTDNAFLRRLTKDIRPSVSDLLGLLDRRRDGDLAGLQRPGPAGEGQVQQVQGQEWHVWRERQGGRPT